MTSTQTRIKKVSFIFRWLFQILFIAVPVLHTVTWIIAPAAFDVSGHFGFFSSAIPQGTVIMHNLTTSTKIYGWLIGAVPMLIVEFILYLLIRLFLLFERVEIFSTANVQYIKKIGYSLLAFQLLNPLFDGLLTALLTFGNPPGHRYASITISGLNIAMVLTALMAILISWIMAEGCRLRDEQQLTI